MTVLSLSHSTIPTLIHSIDYPVKILPYPKSQPIPTFADAIQDLYGIKLDDKVDRVSLATGLMADSSRMSGSDIANRLVDYISQPTPQNLKKVVYPLSMSISTVGPNTGIGQVDVNSLVPQKFRERNSIYIPCQDGWKTALVPAPALATTHHDHYLSGQIMAHFFGKKVAISKT